MTSERSSSAVRDLRSIFENKSAATSPDNISNSRGRSPNGLLSNPNRENSRPTSKVRASFVPVEALPKMAEVESIVNPTNGRRGSTASLRRGSFAEGEDGGIMTDLKKTVSAEQERRENDSSVADTIPESAIESAQATPMPAIGKQETANPFENHAVDEKIDTPGDNPDKPVTGAQEEPANLKPAEPVTSAAVGGAEALIPPVEGAPSKTEETATGIEKSETKPAAKTEVSKKAANKPTVNGKTTSTPAKPASKPAASHPKPAATIKPTAPAAVAPPRLSSKPSRSSLTAPTAASVARAHAAEKTAPVKSQASKPKPRESLKPSELSSRLTAPTAASKARQESAAQTTPSKFDGRASLPVRTTKPPVASSRSHPRASLAPGQGLPTSPRASRTSMYKPPPSTSGGSFLDRMTRPTAASANKTSEKVEPKSPNRAKAAPPASPVKTRTNGVPAGKKAGSKSSRPSTANTQPEVAGLAQEPLTSDVSAHEPTTVEPSIGEAPEATEAKTSIVEPTEPQVNVEPQSVAVNNTSAAPVAESTSNGVVNETLQATPAVEAETTA